MWCPICDKVELERPLIKVVWEEIEKLFEEKENERSNAICKF